MLWIKYCSIRFHQLLCQAWQESRLKWYVTCKSPYRGTVQRSIGRQSVWKSHLAMHSSHYNWSVSTCVWKIGDMGLIFRFNRGHWCAGLLVWLSSALQRQLTEVQSRSIANKIASAKRILAAMHRFWSLHAWYKSPLGPLQHFIDAARTCLQAIAGNLLLCLFSHSCTLRLVRTSQLLDELWYALQDLPDEMIAKK